MSKTIAASAQGTDQTDAREMMTDFLQLFAGDPPVADPPASDSPVGGADESDPPAGTPPAEDPSPKTDPPAADMQTGAPDEYTDFTVPEGLTYDKESAADFLTAA